MELNVKQSGISGRVLSPFYAKTKGGKILKRVHEKYLRNDISCCLKSCRQCHASECATVSDLEQPISSTVPGNHAILVDSTTLIRFHHVLSDERFKNIIVTQTVWDDVKKSNPQAYKAMYSLCYDTEPKRFAIFMNDFHDITHVDPVIGESNEQRLERCLIECVKFYEMHWADRNMSIVIVCANESLRDRYRHYNIQNVFTLREYVEGIKDNAELLDKIGTHDSEDVHSGRFLFAEHLSQFEIQDGLRIGKFKKGVFQVSRENYMEAYAVVDNNTSWFLQGRENCNRAINGDIVAVELLPEEEWGCPEKVIKLRDVEELACEEENDEMDSEIGVDTEPQLKKPRLEDRIPTARVVGIIKRNWREYCGMILPVLVSDSTRAIFSPAERLIPRIRIDTTQPAMLYGKRVIVVIDHWSRDSRYPSGHYVRVIGKAGDRETEEEVLLLEHDIPHDPFSEEVLACLPSLPWTMPEQKYRKDLRSVVICSVDPEGCTDIDDALHCKQLTDDRFEVGVHIADVTHFVRPDTAMDREAAERANTVYLCNRRIDMLPELLSANLCSLRENEDRFAFSVIWTLNSNADIIDVRFHKSVIRSSGALTYAQAQNMIDNKDLNDPVAISLRHLMCLSKKLKEKRLAKGALILASSKVRFSIDSETHEPLAVQESECLDTNSMVEEFMLLANISVAEKIWSEFPDCAILRRHPVPEKDRYKPVIEAAKARGFEFNVDSGKSLSDSLNKAVDPKNPMLNTLFRMMTTRCMTQALYFSSGTLPTEQYIHFGLAASIYTHFTSPIRRYADVMVHRLLAAAINVDSVFPDMLRKEKVEKVVANMNYRHKQAQYVGRASILLNTLLLFKDKTEVNQGFIMGIRKNGLQVFVPKYGFESVIVFPADATNYTVTDIQLTVNNISLKAFQPVKVQLSLNESDLQHVRLDMKLVEPKIPGFSVDFDLSTPEYQ
uniref:Protein DIS3 homolog n=1 Tax=Syphacia muris TaxID=451379 RepID=A0A0N5A9L5_9BILA